MESKKVGVVIPVFNTEASLLKKCIESVIAQTYKNLEICLVNDGSTQEEVLEICKKYCQTYCYSKADKADHYNRRVD